MTPGGLVFWTQLEDPTAADVIAVDGHLIPTEEELERRNIISRVSRLATGGRRTPYGRGGFIAWKGEEVLAQVLVDAPAKHEANFQPVLTVARYRRTTDDPAEAPANISREIGEFLTQVGYVLDEDALDDLARRLVAGPGRGCFAWGRQ